MKKLTLKHDIEYREKDLDFNALLLEILSSPEGTEAFIRYRILDRDGKKILERIDAGVKTPLTAERDADSDDRRNLVIPSGTYYLEEYPDLSEQELLPKTLSNLLGIRSKDEIIVRLYKKDSLACVLQGMRPF